MRFNKMVIWQTSNEVTAFSRIKEHDSCRYLSSSFWELQSV